MSSFHGRFVWYELMTTDTRAAENFYRTVVGWDAQDAGMPDIAYTLFSAGGVQVAGLMELPQGACEAGARPGWNGYVAVDDVDASAAQLEKAGGTIHRAPDDIPGVGRFAMVADPQGAVFALFKGVPGSEAPPVPEEGTPGHGGWRELHAADWQAAFPFYADLFGWTKADAVDMGPMGVYQIFALEGQQVGGMMTDPDAASPFWVYYFNVESIEAAKSRVEAGGGRIIRGPSEVPGGAWIVHCLDPQDAVFALVGPRR